jgi:hypothetical protein
MKYRILLLVPVIALAACEPRKPEAAATPTPTPTPDVVLPAATPETPAQMAPPPGNTTGFQVTPTATMTPTPEPSPGA